MDKFFFKYLTLAAAALLLAGCAAPKDIAYLQDVKQGSEIITVPPAPIRLKPMDQISIVVNGLDPQVSAMFNLPYYSSQLGQVQSLSAGTSGNNLNTGGRISAYTIDSEGYIDFPVIGKIYVKGLTRAQAAEHIKNLLVESRQIKDPVVTIEFTNLSFSVLGEVNRPGRYSIDRDEFTILDAISLAGDLTINGKREDVTLIRNSGTDLERVFTFDLTNSYGLYSSPAYYIQQGDIVYVTPNSKKMRESTVLGNSTLTPTFWVALVSSATSIVTSIISLAVMSSK